MVSVGASSKYDSYPTFVNTASTAATVRPNGRQDEALSGACLTFYTSLPDYTKMLFINKKIFEARILCSFTCFDGDKLYNFVNACLAGYVVAHYKQSFVLTTSVVF